MVTATRYARQQKPTGIENRLLYSVGEDKGGMILPYVKQMTSASPMHEAEHSKLVHWDNPEGWDWEGGGRGFRMGDTCTAVADSRQCMAKTITML